MTANYPQERTVVQPGRAVLAKGWRARRRGIASVAGRSVKR
jgi:hypothetical protein